MTHLNLGWASDALVLPGRWNHGKKQRDMVQNQRERGLGRVLGIWGKAGTRDHGHICRKMLTASWVGVWEKY